MESVESRIYLSAASFSAMSVSRGLFDSVWISRRPQTEVDAELATSRAESGPLAGIRLAVKDNVDVAGLPTTAGCPEFSYQPAEDAPAV